jgi:hypothetical protein
LVAFVLMTLWAMLHPRPWFDVTTYYTVPEHYRGIRSIIRRHQVFAEYRTAIRLWYLAERPYGSIICTRSPEHLLSNETQKVEWIVDDSTLATMMALRWS